jgi:hypothetical protein
MAKTQFVEGSYLTPAWCNSAYYTGGGHVHDGVSDDGHSSQIDLTQHVTGILPDANIAWGSIRGYIDGYQITPVVGTFACSITVSAGTCRDSANVYNVPLTTAMSKNILNGSGSAFVTWTAGTGGGGTAVISPAVQWLHVFAIYNPTSVLTDIFVDTAIDGSNRPVSYTHARRIGSIYIEQLSPGVYGIKRFTQKGDKITWSAQSLRLNLNSTLTCGVTYDATVLTPPAVVTDTYGSLAYKHSSSDSTLRLGSIDPPDELFVQTLDGTYLTSYFQLNTDSSSRIRLRADGTRTGGSVWLYTGGYYDQRGKDA